MRCDEQDVAQFEQRPYLVARISGLLPGPPCFRLDRVRWHAVLPKPFMPDPGFNLQAFAQRSFGAWQEEPFAVCLRFAPEAAAEAAAFHFHPTQTREHRPDGSLLVRLTAGGALEMCATTSPPVATGWRCSSPPPCAGCWRNGRAAWPGITPARPRRRAGVSGARRVGIFWAEPERGRAPAGGGDGAGGGYPGQPE